MRHNRFYRVFRTTITIAAALLRYFWLTQRSRFSWSRPSQAKWDRAHDKSGRAIYRLATKLGGAYVKLGQVLGGRGDFFPEAFVAPLKGLHDQVPARPLEDLKGHIEEQLGKPIEAVFESFEETPLAAASLAQVHRAVLHSGDVVAVKVQYPEAQRLFPTDLGSLRRAARAARWLNRSLDLRSLVDELAHFVVLELSFEREATSTQRVRKLLASDEMITVPSVFTEHSTDKLLVLEFVEGISLAHDDELDEANIDRRVVASSIAGVYAAMIFEHGFFHGDPHPGNFLARPDGSLALLDFGLAKELPEGFADDVAAMLMSAFSGDGEQAMSAAESIGFVFKKRDPAPFLATLRMLLGDYSDPDRAGRIIKSAAIEAVPPEFALVVRAFVLLNGLSHRLVPNERLIMNALSAKLLARIAQSKQRQTAS